MGIPLILFGAGASYGSETHDTPPLGENLFDALCRFSPAKWGAVDDGFARQFRTNFEEGMKAFADAHPSDGIVDQLHCDMATCFFRFRPKPSSLYVRLAERIRTSNWNGVLVSLNYERLLEQSLRMAGLDVVLSGTVSLNGGIELCLPHGCCNLFCNVRAESPAPGAGYSGGLVHGAGPSPCVNLAAHAPSIIKPAKRPDGTEILTTLRTQNGTRISLGPHLWVDSEQYRVLNSPDEHAKEFRESTIPPVMCYFQAGKNTRAGVSFIEAQRNRFADLVRTASTVAIIGVGVRPHDRHLWDALAQTPARLVYCAGKTGASDFKRWAENCKRNDDRAIPAFWRDGFDEICSALMP